MLIVFENNKYKLIIDFIFIINDYLIVGNISNFCIEIFIVVDKCLYGINKIVIEFWLNDFFYNKIKL